MNANKYLCLVVLLFACNQSPTDISNNLAFENKLSAYALFKTALVPADDVTILEIGSTLFTDYAEKQRLLKLPPGKKVILHGDSLPIFPEGTILAKTFYYSKDSIPQLIETRLLVLKDNKWNAATYRWNKDQQDATLLTEGAIVPVTLSKQLSLAYKIPAQADCASCHRSGNQLTPIGPKGANLNILVTRNGIRQQQLAYLMNKKVVEHIDLSAIASMPDYHDTTLAIANRARAYLDINCAHCHNSTGMAANTSLRLGYFLPYNQTGIAFNKQNILVRMSTMGEFHMPRTGTTIIHKEGLQLVKQYIHELKK